MTKVILATKNPARIQAVRNVLEKLFPDRAIAIGGIGNVSKQNEYFTETLDSFSASQTTRQYY
ncbi:MAG: hypothetical protein Q8Q18_00680 [bacterium]|nr:hypothetical protein [bacterium]